MPSWSRLMFRFVDSLRVGTCVMPGRSTRNTHPGGGGGSAELGTGGGCAGCPGAARQPPRVRSTSSRMAAASKSPAAQQTCENAQRFRTFNRSMHAQLPAFQAQISFRYSQHREQPRHTSYAQDRGIRALPALQVRDHIAPLQRAHL